MSQSRISHITGAAGAYLSEGLLSRRRLWIGPALTAVAVVMIGWWTQRSVEAAVKEQLAGQLQTLLEADVAALRIWLAGQRADAAALADDQRVRAPVAELVEIASRPASISLTADLLTAPPLDELRQHLLPYFETHRLQGFVVIDRSSRLLAADNDMGIGELQLAQGFQELLADVFEGQTVFVPPFKSLLVQPDVDGIPRAGVPVMFVATPVRDEQGEILAALCLRIRPEEEFTQILSVARAGVSGETYAFNRRGLLLTNSRFDDDLKRLGLLSDDDQTRSLLNLDLRDPGVDMTKGLRPQVRRAELPLTRMAAAAVAGEAGVDTDGYRDYRGVPVVGAWTWLPEYGFGVATKVDVAEAFRPVYMLRTAFGVLAGLLGLTTLAMFGLAWHASRLENRARHAVLEAKRLGQYALGEKLGSGGMGVVYRARHDMLHRPTAVKLLHVDRTDEQAIARFEREVQATSQLTHPNTVAIFDYGRTPEGVFYYAMEYLEGVSLDELVTRFGSLPSSRVIFILRQLCGSLSEAHALGLIHRDIKPSNIMLTQRGGPCDFVKLLDFGLVKPQNAERDMTLAGSLTGTPLYLSPEAIQHAELDARSDLYAVGAVGYFMLTGRPVFDGGSIVDICNQHVSTSPLPPSQRLGAAVDERLEELILRCLAKNPDDRPDTAEVLEQLLSQCPAAQGWSQADARAWWAEHLESKPEIRDTSTAAAALTETILQPGPARTSGFPA